MSAPTAWLLSLLALIGCAGELCGPSYLAELAVHRGEVQRDVASAVGTWQPARDGARFDVGDGLRTGPGGSAQLTLWPEGLALVEENTLLRFVDRDPRSGERRMAVQEGRLRVESGKLELEVHTPRGLARLEQGARVRIEASPDAVRLDVLVGRIALDQDGVRRALVAGDNVRLARDEAAGAEGIGEAAGAALAREAGSAEDAGSDAEIERAVGDVPARVHEVALPFAPSTLHATTLPVRLRLRGLPECAEPLALELDGRRPHGDPADDARAPLLLLRSAGAHRVRVRCQRRVLASSVLHVQRDAPGAELPRRAQHVEIDADGRRYTVRYQNVVPVLHVGWKAAQPSASYTLLLRRGSRRRSMRGGQPRQVLESGSLSAGVYDFWFTSSEGHTSEVSALRIELDGSARALSLDEPRDGNAVGAFARVSGAALLGFEVSANGVPLPLDEQGRFSGVAPVSEAKIVLVRAQHPALGVHYYLRTLR